MKKNQVNISEIEEFVARAAKSLKGGEVFGLVGNLGAGKTTFTQALAKALSIKQRVNSPTYTLMHSFQGFLPSNSNPVTLHHIDAYRLKHASQLEELGVNDFLGKAGTITCVEWADMVRDALPRSTQYIYLENNKEAGVNE